jgi:hypothetical protein
VPIAPAGEEFITEAHRQWRRRADRSEATRHRFGRDEVRQQPAGGIDGGTPLIIPSPIPGDLSAVVRLPFAETAAELLNRFLPYDPAALWADAEGLLDSLSDSLPDGEFLEVSTDWWYVLGALVLYTTVSRKKRQTRLATRRVNPQPIA